MCKSEKVRQDEKERRKNIGYDLWRVYHPGTYPGHAGPLSLAIPTWVGATITRDGFGSLWEETALLKLRPVALDKSVYK